MVAVFPKGQDRRSQPHGLKTMTKDKLHMCAKNAMEEFEALLKESFEM